MRTGRRTSMVVGLVVLAAVVAACAVPVPPGARRISPADGTGYVDPLISGDGDTVVYRREADLGVDTFAPRDLIVTTVSTGTTRVLPDVANVLALSHDGSHVLHGVDDVKVTDTASGASTTVRSGQPYAFGKGALSADGRTAAFTEYHLTGGFCPCVLRLHVWRDGAEVLDLPLSADWVEGQPSFGPFVALDSAGERAFLYRNFPRAIIELDLSTSVMTTVPVEFPPPPDLSDISPLDDLDEYYRLDTVVDAGASDGTAFRYLASGVPYLVRTGGPPLALPVPQLDDPAPISPNGRWIAWVQRVVPWPGQTRLSYRVRDLDTGVTREVVASEPLVGPRSTFNGTGTVSDSGRAAFGHWAAPLSGPWPPSVILIAD